MKKNLILALSAAFVFNVANVSEAAVPDFAISSPIINNVEMQDLEYQPSREHRPSPPPTYIPQPAPPFLTDKQKKAWRKQEVERAEWFDDARKRWQKENSAQSQRRK